MTLNRSYTSATSSSSQRLGSILLPVLVGLLCVAGLLLRMQRLAWQPLWWDEGYSIYFATESLARMTWLTARDIHPPLYYALLHAWFKLFSASDAVTARWLSVLTGLLALPAMAWVAHRLFPQRPRVVWLSVLLLTISPFHLFYSQEVRMYGLALLLCLLATGFFADLIHVPAEGTRRGRWALAGYVLTGALCLLTLYYSAFVLAAHQIWALVQWWRTGRVPRIAWLAALLILLLQLPWWGYAIPKLLTYVQDKVIADQDEPLAVWTYLWRHVVAITAGHLPWPGDLATWRVLAPLVIIPPIGAAFIATRNRVSASSTAMAILVVVPLTLGFVINLLYPFFPEGGERLMLFVLPFALILFSRGIDRVAAESQLLGIVAALLLMTPALIGCYVFFTTPRYVEHDYRPIVRFVMQNARRHDTVHALFPWQVGYWRAYSPRQADGSYLPPQPAPLDQQALIWNPVMRAELDAALHRGTVWFPAPLSFGSRLPGEIEAYLQTKARNLENQWFSPATRLSAWVGHTEAPNDTTETIQALYDDLTLVSAAVGPAMIASDNAPLRVDLTWQGTTEGKRASLRLLDEAGVQWGQRDLPLLGLPPADGDAAAAEPVTAQIAFVVPVGLPPGPYHLFIGVGPAESEQFSRPQGLSPDDSPLIPLAAVDVIAPEHPPSVYRLPVDAFITPPPQLAGITLLGHAGLSPSPKLAGTDLALRLFFAKDAPGPDAQIYLSLIDGSDRGVAGIQEWPLPSYPPNAWPDNALVQVPVTLPLPPDIPAGSYRLVAGIATDSATATGTDTATAARTTPAPLGQVIIERRAVAVTPPPLDEPVDPAVLFGSHARLVGYSTRIEDNRLHVSLTWQIEQALRPPHHVFVHLQNGAGERIAQADDPPITADGPAPSGSWLPGEYLTTQHTLTLPAEMDELDSELGDATLHVGLYDPKTLVRLPASVDGVVQGDDAVLPLSQP